MNALGRPVVLDIDRSVGPLPDRLVLSLEHWQERLRFGCRVAVLQDFAQRLERLLPSRHGTVMLGSGDFHHLSWPLIARVPGDGPFQVVVLDNHPDNMRYLFGVHCGSWVRRVAQLPRVAHVHVVGIASPDAGRGQAWANYLSPLRRGRLSYWCLGLDTHWPDALGVADAVHGFETPVALLDAFLARLADRPLPTYLSIDKDVFDAEVARTNWDQGRFRLEHALRLIAALPGPLVGSDITGEVSMYHYRSRLKRHLAALDDQPAVDQAMLADWQAQQHALNLRLIGAIAERAESGR